jgi:hypothetical protein
MINTRINVFETNSSSTHSFTVAKELGSLDSSFLRAKKIGKLSLKVFNDLSEYITSSFEYKLRYIISSYELDYPTDLDYDYSFKDIVNCANSKFLSKIQQLLELENIELTVNFYIHNDYNYGDRGLVKQISQLSLEDLLIFFASEDSIFCSDDKYKFYSNDYGVSTLEKIKQHSDYKLIFTASE